MKSSQHKLFLQLTLVCGILLCAAIGVNAQTTTSISSSSEKVDYVSPEIAVQRLDNAIQLLKEQMAGLAPGTQLYKQLEGRYAYLDSIRRIIKNEKTKSSEDISMAIIRSMGTYASDAYGYVPEQQRQENRQYAVDLLRL